MKNSSKDRESLFPATLGVSASVVFDSEGGPRTVNEETKQDYRDIGPGRTRYFLTLSASSCFV